MGINQPLHRKLRMALVGGGQGAFIGRVHATAAVLDNRASLVAGALSSNPERAKASAADYDIATSRAYGSYQEMLEQELLMLFLRLFPVLFIRLVMKTAGEY